MRTKDRLKTIIQELQSKGQVNTVELAESLEVSTMTIRRDLNKFAHQGLITLTHGGAIINRGSLFEHNTSLKEDVMVQEKRNIAKYCVDLISDGDSIFLDGGTTTKEIAVLLLDRKNIVVLTNSLYCATALSAAKGITLIMVPGEFRETSMAFLGPFTNEFIAKFKIDIVFLPCEGFDPIFGASVPNTKDADTKRFLAKHAKKIILVADSSKLGSSYLCNICSVEDVDLLVTDSGANLDILSQFRSKGLEVITV